MDHRNFLILLTIFTMEAPKYLRRRKHTPKHHSEVELVEEMFDR